VRENRADLFRVIDKENHHRAFVGSGDRAWMMQVVPVTVAHKRREHRRAANPMVHEIPHEVLMHGLPLMQVAFIQKDIDFKHDGTSGLFFVGI
jgi:hypothetical protein